MEENLLSHVLFLFLTDLNASQTQGPQAGSPNHGSIQPPQVEPLMLNHQPESLQDAEGGDGGEENIVYLWWLTVWFQ